MCVAMYRMHGAESVLRSPSALRKGIQRHGHKRTAHARERLCEIRLSARVREFTRAGDRHRAQIWIRRSRRRAKEYKNIILRRRSRGASRSDSPALERDSGSGGLHGPRIFARLAHRVDARATKRVRVIHFHSVVNLPASAANASSSPPLCRARSVRTLRLARTRRAVAKRRAFSRTHRHVIDVACVVSARPRARVDELEPPPVPRLSRALGRASA